MLSSAVGERPLTSRPRAAGSGGPGRSGRPPCRSTPRTGTGPGRARRPPVPAGWRWRAGARRDTPRTGGSRRPPAPRPSLAARIIAPEAAPRRPAEPGRPPRQYRLLARRPEEAAQNQVLESRLELGRDLLRHRLRSTRALGLRARSPSREIGLALGGPVPHRHRVDEVLEPLGQRDAGRLPTFLR